MDRFVTVVVADPRKPFVADFAHDGLARIFLDMFSRW